MDPKLSIELPMKRHKNITEKCRPSLVMKLSEKAYVRKINEEEFKLIINYTEKFPGENYDEEYWDYALKNGLQLNYSAENLKAVWTSYQNNKNFITDETDEIPAIADQKKIIVFCMQGLRKVYEMDKLQALAEKQKIILKFDDVVQKCKKIIKKDVGPSEVFKQLVQYKGDSQEMMKELIKKNSQKQLQSIYEDCCSLSGQNISFEKFLSFYLKCDGMIVSLYNHFKKL